MKRPACIVAAIGASGSGKTTWLRQRFLSPMPERLAVWDFKREYLQLPALELGDAVRAMARPRFRFRVLPPLDPAKRAQAFDLFCKACYQVGDLLVIVEELAFVTTPQRAPDAWRLMILTGRDYVHRGRRRHLQIVFTSQRPASIDKDCFGNSTLIRCGRLTAPRDVQTMARVLGVPELELAQLPDLAYVERDVLTGALERGRLRLRAAPKATELRPR